MAGSRDREVAWRCSGRGCSRGRVARCGTAWLGKARRRADDRLSLAGRPRGERREARRTSHQVVVRAALRETRPHCERPAPHCERPAGAAHTSHSYRALRVRHSPCAPFGMCPPPPPPPGDGMRWCSSRRRSRRALATDPLLSPRARSLRNFRSRRWSRRALATSPLLPPCPRALRRRRSRQRSQQALATSPLLPPCPRTLRRRRSRRRSREALRVVVVGGVWWWPEGAGLWRQRTAPPFPLAHSDPARGAEERPGA